MCITHSISSFNLKLETGISFSSLYNKCSIFFQQVKLFLFKKRSMSWYKPGTYCTSINQVRIQSCTLTGSLSNSLTLRNIKISSSKCFLVTSTHHHVWGVHNYNCINHFRIALEVQYIFSNIWQTNLQIPLWVQRSPCVGSCVCRCWGHWTPHSGPEPWCQGVRTGSLWPSLPPGRSCRIPAPRWVSQ